MSDELIEKIARLVEFHTETLTADGMVDSRMVAQEIRDFAMAQQDAAPYTPEYLYKVAVNARIPIDFKKKMALFELIDALEKPDSASLNQNTAEQNAAQQAPCYSEVKPSQDNSPLEEGATSTLATHAAERLTVEDQGLDEATPRVPAKPAVAAPIAGDAAAAAQDALVIDSLLAAQITHEVINTCGNQGGDTWEDKVERGVIAGLAHNAARIAALVADNKQLCKQFELRANAQDPLTMAIRERAEKAEQEVARLTADAKPVAWWLIEKQENIAFYWEGAIEPNHQYWRWNRDASKAVRFPTEEAAKNVLGHLKLWQSYVDGNGGYVKEAKAVEHIFCNAPSHADIDCAQYLKDGETPAERITRALKDIDGLLTMLAQEKRKNESAASKIAQLNLDAMTLALRLMGENDDSFAPETREVMKRFRPMCEALLQGEENEM